MIKSIIKIIIILLVATYFSPSFAQITISEDTTWNEAGSPYVFNDDVIVADGITLEVSPGTVVKFANGKGLYVKGHLRINGTNSSRVVFTAINGRWKGIVVDNGSPCPCYLTCDSYYLHNCYYDNYHEDGYYYNGHNKPSANIKYLDISKAETALDINFGTLTLKWSWLYANYTGIDIHGVSDVHIEESVIAKNGKGILWIDDSPLFVEYGDMDSYLRGDSYLYENMCLRDAGISVVNSYIINNGGNGIDLEFVTDCLERYIENNIIAGNGGYGVFISDGDYYLDYDICIYFDYEYCQYCMQNYFNSYCDEYSGEDCYYDPDCEYIIGNFFGCEELEDQCSRIPLNLTTIKNNIFGKNRLSNINVLFNNYGYYQNPYLSISGNCEGVEFKDPANMDFTPLDTVCVLSPTVEPNQALNMSDTLIGALYQDTTFDSDIELTGGIYVPDGITLKIQRGINIYLREDAGIFVEGGLEFIESESGNNASKASVTFKPIVEDKKWDGLYFYNKENLALRNINILRAKNGLVLRASYGEIRSSQFTSCDNAIKIYTDPSPFDENLHIHSCVFRNNSDDISFKDMSDSKTTTLKVTNSLFIDGRIGIDINCYDNELSFLLYNNVFDSYSYDAIRFFNRINAYLYNNIFIDNDEALYLSRYTSLESFDISYNDFYNNNYNLKVGYSTYPLPENNYQLDPLFVTSGSRNVPEDYRLLPNSPCIDSGKPDMLDRDGSRSDLGIWGGNSDFLQNRPPHQPENVSPADGQDIQINNDLCLQASEFQDDDEGDTHIATRWQLRKQDSSNLLVDVQDHTHLLSYCLSDVPADILSNLELDSVYCWKVSYQDDFFNWSPFSEETCFTLQRENTPPEVNIDWPYDSYLFDTQKYVCLNWDGSDNVQLGLKIFYKVDNREWQGPITTNQYCFLSHEGNNTFTVKAVDLSGNQRIASVSFIVDTQPPSITNIDVTNITHDSATLCTTTDEEVVASIQYGPSSEYLYHTDFSSEYQDENCITLSGLESDATYHYKVTVRDRVGHILDSEDSTFHTAVNTEDSEAPRIEKVLFDGNAVSDGLVIGSSGRFSVKAQDSSGVSRVEFYLDGSLVHTAYSGISWFAWDLDINSIPDGTHELKIKAFDTFNKERVNIYSINIQMPPPQAPDITEPANGTITNQDEIYVRGIAEKGTSVIIYVNGAVNGAPQIVDNYGHFKFTVELGSGQNEIYAVSENRGGRSQESSHIFVTLDKSIPKAPIGLYALSKAGGIVHLTWSTTTGESVKGYNIYRSTSPFTNTSSATRVNSSLITQKSYNDIPLSDGIYYYGVTSVSLAGTEGVLSEVVRGVSDRTPPTCEITYSPKGLVNPHTGAISQGEVDLVLTVSEPLEATPFLTITPEGGVPMPVDLVETAPLTYEGSFTILEHTPTGTAYAVFSARDLAGNRGTTVTTGGSILLDTKGPEVVTLDVAPGDPIRNDSSNPVEVHVRLGLDEAVKEGTTPYLAYTLSSSHTEETPITLSQDSPHEGEAEAWAGSFTLPPEAGLDVPETLTLLFHATDELENNSTKIGPAHEFQVYQGGLPPLPTPTGLTAESRKGGYVELAWNEVEGTDGYEIYRRPLGESTYTVVTRSTNTSFTDLPPEDGTYEYSVSSIRHANGQEALSAKASPCRAVSDRIPPSIPRDLTLKLSGQGIVASWQIDTLEDGLTFKLYRSTDFIGDPAEARLIAQNIQDTAYIDSHPSIQEHFYAVVAVDRYGNESPPSDSEYLNFELVPVRDVHVFFDEGHNPVITWSPGGESISGYEFFISSEGQRVKVTKTDLLESSSYEDTSYSGGTREYTIIPVDTSGQKSAGHSIELPDMQITLSQGTLLRRNLMNQVNFIVSNNSKSAIKNATLTVTVHNRTHTSLPFSINATGSTVVPVVIGGYSDLEDQEPLVIDLVITPQAGDEVRIRKSGAVECTDGVPGLDLYLSDFVRGGTGKIRFRLENTGGASMDVISAVGNSPSPDIHFYLLDPDENILSTATFTQRLGEGVRNLANGKTVIRLAPGEAFTSNEIEIPVPEAAPDTVYVKMVIDHIYHDLGGTDEVTMGGATVRRPASLVETPYYAEITSITPRVSYGVTYDSDGITIEGRAIERSTGAPIGLVPVNLVVSLNGFEKSYTLYTGEAGDFNYVYYPQPGESGNYTVSALHPSILERPHQGWFIIHNLSVRPTLFKASMPRNYDQEITLHVSTGPVTDVQNLHLELNAIDQPKGVLPQGITVDTSQSIHVPPRTSKDFRFTIRGDSTAEAETRIVLKLVGEVSGSEHEFATVVGDIHLSEAVPVLSWSPSYIETGLAQGELQVESLTLKNAGLADLTGVTLSLVDESGAPAPSWVSLASPSEIGTLAPGEERAIDINFAPPSDLPSGTYTYYLKVESNNYATKTIGLYCYVTQSGQGNVLFKVEDIYSGAVDNTTGEIIQGVEGARITVQNEDVLSITRSGTTDHLGELTFNNLPAGIYKYRVTAPNHNEKTGNFWIKPGITTTEKVYLQYSLISVEWEVNEKTIEDRYDITLHATYETNVPAAVVVLEPSTIKIPDMKAGDVFYGEFTLTNYGLVMAEDMAAYLPEDDENYHFEFLIDIPSTLGPHERLVIPYKVTCIKTPGESGEMSGGASGCKIKWARVIYIYKCVNRRTGESWTESSTTYQLIVIGTCRGSSSSNGGGGSGTCEVYFFDGGGSDSSDGTGAHPGPGPSPQEVSGTKCWPLAKVIDPDTRLLDMLSWLWDKLKDAIKTVGCEVDNRNRQFMDDSKDLVVKVPGGKIEIIRRFYNNKWQWDHEAQNLSFEKDPISGFITLIKKGGIEYSPKADISGFIVQEPTVFKNGTATISKIGENFKWIDINGNWKIYDKDGLLKSYGNRDGLIATLKYKDGLWSGIVDRKNRQIIWVTRNNGGRILSIKDLTGRVVSYDYHGDNLVRVTDVLGQNTTYEYDSKGHLIRKVDSGGRPTIVAYDSYGNVKSVVDKDGNGHFFQFDYDHNTKEYYAQIKSSSGKIKEIWFDRDGYTKKVQVNGKAVYTLQKTKDSSTSGASGEVLIIKDEKGNITKKEFDQWDRLIRITRPDGGVISFEYDNILHKPIKIIDPLGIVTVFEYDDKGHNIKKIEALGKPEERITEFTYSAEGYLLSVTVRNPASNVSATTSFTYDPNGNISTITDPDGGVTRFEEYDAMGNPLRIVDPRGNTWIYTYDALGRLTSITDPLGNTTTYEYDGANNRTAVINAYLKRFGFEYDDHNNLVKVIDPYGFERLTAYNTDGLPVEFTDEEGKTSSREYDNEGRLVKEVDGTGNIITYVYDDTTASSAPSKLPVEIHYPTYTKKIQYDNMGRVLKISRIMEDNTVLTETMTYDKAGHLLTKTDEEGRTTSFQYDALGRLVKTTDAAGNEILRVYDVLGNLIELHDPNQGITHFEYDKSGRLLKLIRPLGQTTEYTWDAVGNKTSKLDPDGRLTVYEYDAANRLTKVRYYAPDDHETPERIVEFSYDRLGRMVGWSDGTFSGQISYDDLGRKLSETVNYGTFSKTFSYSWYANGLEKSFTSPSGITYYYAYDDGNRLVSIQIPSLGQITVNEYHWNAPARITYPGGVVRSIDYDSLMRPESINVSAPEIQNILNYAYQYSRSGNIVAKNTESGTYVYGYDALNRLISVDNPDGILPDESFTYDALGNRIASEGIEGDWSYNQNNQLLSYDGVSFTYDAAGHVTGKNDNGEIRHFFYNAAGRLVRVEDNATNVIARYGYDPFGKRLWKEVNGERTYFFYTDEGLAAEMDANGNIIKEYGYWPGSAWGTAPLFMFVDGQYYWYLNDHLGTPQKLIDISGAVVWSANYESFGKAHVEVSLIENNLRFPGQYYDAETGLHYNWHRYYDPVSGRYWSEDEISLLDFIYAENNPLSSYDPLGLCVLKNFYHNWFNKAINYLERNEYLNRNALEVLRHHEEDIRKYLERIPMNILAKLVARKNSILRSALRAKKAVNKARKLPSTLEGVIEFIDSFNPKKDPILKTGEYWYAGKDQHGYDVYFPYDDSQPPIYKKNGHLKNKMFIGTQKGIKTIVEE